MIRWFRVCLAGAVCAGRADTVTTVTQHCADREIGTHEGGYVDIKDVCGR